MIITSSVRLFAILLVLAITLSIGCGKAVSGGTDVEHATIVSVSQLQEATRDETSFWWIGTDKEFHYFEAKSGFYRVSTEFEMPQFANRIKAMLDRNAKPGSMGRVQVYRDGGIFRASSQSEK